MGSSAAPSVSSDQDEGLEKARIARDSYHQFNVKSLHKEMKPKQSHTKKENFSIFFAVGT